MALDRRRFLTGSLAALFGGVAGCGPALPRRIDGELLGPDLRLGHRLRDGGLGEPTRKHRARVLIVGGGIAGLSAAWRLQRAGFEDFALLELEPEAGGNARAGHSPVTPYPWGAHYLPLPTAEAGSLVDLLADLGVVTGRRADGSPIYEDRYLLTPPHERLFQYGLWRPGLRPLVSSRAETQFRELDARVADLGSRRGEDGRPAFTTPTLHSSRDASLRALDTQRFDHWLDAQGLDDEALRWYLEYGCRDDFGTLLSGTSTWAGLHYQCGRRIWGPYAEGQLLTWPEGNAWIARALAQRLGDRLHCSRMAVRVQADDAGVEVDAWDGDALERWHARELILCVPGYVAERLLPQAPRCAREYHPWLVANVHVSRMPAGNGAEPTWDSVIYGAQDLGYVVATHQRPAQHTGATVLTCYHPFPGGGLEARRALQAMDWDEAARRVLQGLRAGHPGIEEVVERIDVWRWGHGMVAPVPGLIHGAALARLRQPLGRVHLAHSDLSGLSLFEEAHWWGVRAAERVLKTL